MITHCVKPIHNKIYQDTPLRTSYALVKPSTNSIKSHYLHFIDKKSEARSESLVQGHTNTIRNLQASLQQSKYTRLIRKIRQGKAGTGFIRPSTNTWFASCAHMYHHTGAGGTFLKIKKRWLICYKQGKERMSRTYIGQFPRKLKNMDQFLCVQFKNFKATDINYKL